ncbi:hypothetical protein GCM10010412_097640 [Nonomuraea recticatena]|uniref:Uncharacterized protein n=1 Tax=Nonomuraea recticatena TaxID=46178 RepID=A0ABP6FUW2_9ACTN
MLQLLESANEKPAVEYSQPQISRESARSDYFVNTDNLIEAAKKLTAEYEDEDKILEGRPAEKILFQGWRSLVAFPEVYPEGYALKAIGIVAHHELARIYKDFRYQYRFTGRVVNQAAGQYLGAEQELLNVANDISGEDKDDLQEQDSRPWWAGAGVAEKQKLFGEWCASLVIGFNQRDIEDWNPNCEDLYRTVHAMRPEQTREIGVLYEELRDRIRSSLTVLREQHENIFHGWGGEAANLCLDWLRGLESYGIELENAAATIANAYAWHEGKQRTWQEAMRDHDWMWRQLDDWVPNAHSLGREVAQVIQWQTLATIYAFPLDDTPWPGR